MAARQPYVPFTVNDNNSQSTPSQLTFDTTTAPWLTPWTRSTLAPVLAEWYGRIEGLLPSPPSDSSINPYTNVTIVIEQPAKDDWVANTLGSTIKGNAAWLGRELDREAVGAMVHECVHVVQRYAVYEPGWLTEGIADYIRWFLFEPQSHGADRHWMRRVDVAQRRHDASYRTTANFLSWVVGNNHQKDVIAELNRAMRNGQYSPDVWERLTGKPVERLAELWRDAVARELSQVDLSS